MGDMNRTLLAPSSRTMKPKRPVVAPSASTRKIPSASTVKDKFNARAKLNRTISSDSALPDFDPEYREIAYGKFLLAMLEDCLVEEKIKREDDEIDLQVSRLANRFNKTVDLLDKTSRRLRDMKFIVEQKRLLDLKTTECTKFCEVTDESNIQNLVNGLIATEQSCLDKLETKNVDLGYSKQSGHQQLLHAVTEAVDGLDQIKKHSNLDPHKFEEYGKSGMRLKELEKDRFDLERTKTDFEDKFPKISEKLLKQASAKIADMMKSDNETDDVGADEEEEE